MRKLRLGGYQPERSVHTRAARALEASLTLQTAGKLAIDVIPQITALGRPAAELLSMTENGELELCYFASSYLVERVPELGVLDLPFEDIERASIWRRLDGEAGRLLREAVKRGTGYELLAFWDNGIRHISNGIRPIHTPDDCAGLSIRTLDSAFHQSIFSALGFLPRYIDVKDLGVAVRTRTIDAQENPLTNLVNFALHETHRHVSLTGHFFGIALLLGNAAAIATLDVAERATLDRCIAEATEVQRALAAAEDETCLAQLRAEGVAIVPPGEIDREAFRAKVRAVVEKAARRIDSMLLAAWREQQRPRT